MDNEEQKKSSDDEQPKAENPSEKASEDSEEPKKDSADSVGVTPVIGNDMPEAPVVNNTNKYNVPLEGSVARQPMTKGMGKAILIALIAVAIAIIGVVAVWITHDDPIADNNASQATNFGVAVTYMEGIVETRLPGGDWTAVDPDQTLNTQREVRTGENGKVILTIDDGSAVRLDYNSEAKLTSLRSDSVVIETVAGQVYTRVADLATRSFEVIVGDTGFVSLGTAFRTLNNDKTKGVEVFQSQVSVKSDGTQVNEGEGYYKLVSGNEIDKPVELDIEKIKNDDFIKWNREKDSEIEEYRNKLGYIEDFDAPNLSVSTPKTGASTEDAKITVAGTTDNSAKLFINDVEVETTEGVFEISFDLNVGKNIIIIVAKDDVGNKTTKTVTVTRKDADANKVDGAGIILSALARESDIAVNWTAGSIDAKDGYKVVYSSTNKKPVYGDDSAEYSQSTAHELALKDGKTYYIRVCVYKEASNACSSYSNVITIKAPNKL